MNMYLINKKSKKKIILVIILVCAIHILYSVDPAYAKKYVLISFVKNKILQKILFQAATNGNHLAIIDAIKRNVQLNIQDNQGFTPLMIAVVYGHHNVVEALLAAGAELYIKNNVGKTALDYALETKNKKIRDIVMQATKKY